LAELLGLLVTNTELIEEFIESILGVLLDLSSFVRGKESNRARGATGSAVSTRVGLTVDRSRFVLEFARQFAASRLRED
jgi:hypothetical protein